ncbi:MAG: TonB-dependent receptor [Sphingobacteriales bacterium]|nr:MAG: TonB-dependent receptor [Sphingobacteriales bacterium]
MRVMILKGLMMKSISLAVPGAVLSIAMLSSAGAVHAQDSSAPTNSSAQDYADNAIIVTARKRDENLQDVPLAVSVETAADIARKGLRDVTDVAAFSPGLSFERANRYGTQGGSSRPVIRGMGNILGESNVQIFIDGIPFSDSILSFPFDLVERIEVIKGPQAALYGRATFAGAINLITKKGSNDFNTSVKVRAATYDDYEINAISRGPLIQDKLFYMVAARYYDFGGMYKNTLDGRSVGGEKSVNFNGSLEFKPTSDLSILLSGGYLYDRDEVPAVGLQDRFSNNCYFNNPGQYYCGTVHTIKNPTLDIDGLEGDAGGLPSKPGLTRNSHRVYLAINYETGGFKITSNSGYSKTRTEFGYDSTYQGATAINPTGVPGAPGYVRPLNNGVRSGSVMRNDVGSRKEIFTELRVQSPKFADAFDVMIGGAYYQRRRPFEERHYRGFDGTVAPTIDSGTDRIDNIAVFGSLNWSVTDRFDISAEIRYAEDKIGNFKKATGVLAERKFASTSPRLTANYDISDGSMIYATIAKGNKPGVFNSDPRFPVAIQFAGEETSWNYEIGSKNRFFDNRLTLNISAYYVDWSDQQLSATYTFPDLQTRGYIINAGKTRVKGVEIELEGNITNELSAGASYSINDARFTEFNDTEAGTIFGNTSVAGKLVPNISRDQASGFVNYLRPVTSELDFFARADASYNSPRYAQIYNLADTGSKYLVNLRMGVQGPNWKATLFVENLLDDRAASSVGRYVDQLNLNVPQYTNANPAQNNAPGTTNQERAFQIALARKRQFGLTLEYDF